jgi:hypothetical protein
MKVSRRKFLGAASGSAATLMSFGPLRWNVAGPRADAGFDCALIDLPQCVLRESFSGYQSALAGGHAFLSVGDLDAQLGWRMAIVPGLGQMDSVTAQALSDLLYEGAVVILESAGGFMSPTEFGAHQKMLDRYFGVAVEEPVEMWNADTRGHARIPYVNYAWPRPVMVRDFSRVVPVSPNSGEVIGTVGDLPVAVKKRVAQGTLIFLGSALGPLLGAGDAEARSWIHSVRTLCS